MSQDDLAPVERLYERLTESLQRTRRQPFDAPVTVAEIYQELVPYRLVRTEIGFDMNADYEHALLRLLAGEGEHVRVEPPHATEEIRRELRNANPNLSLYREYAACDVWVRKPTATPNSGPTAPTRVASSPVASDASATRGQDWRVPANGSAGTDTADATPFEIFTLAEDQPVEEPVEKHAYTPPPSAPAMSEARSTESLPTAPAVSAARPQVAESERSIAPAPEQVSAQHQPGAEAPRCTFCDSAMPQQRSARFCPYCGADQTNRPCSSCGEVVEPGWVYCVACGTPAQ